MHLWICFSILVTCRKNWFLLHSNFLCISYSRRVSNEFCLGKCVCDLLPCFNFVQYITLLKQRDSVVIAEVKEICHFFLKTLPNCYGSWNTNLSECVASATAKWCLGLSVVVLISPADCILLRLLWGKPID